MQKGIVTVPGLAGVGFLLVGLGGPVMFDLTPGAAQFLVVLGVVLLIMALVVHFFGVGSGNPKSGRTLERRAAAYADSLAGRLQLADRAIAGSRADLTKWRKKAPSQLVFRADRLDAIDLETLPNNQAVRLERAIPLIAELNEIAQMTGQGEGYVTLKQAAGRYVNCGSKLYTELAAIAGLDPDWRTTDGRQRE